MVDEIITRQELIDAKRDARDLGKAVNEKVIVSPRYGDDFKSLPMIAEEAQSTIGEWESAISLITQEGGVPALAVSDSSGKTQQEINDLTIKFATNIANLRTMATDKAAIYQTLGYVLPNDKGSSRYHADLSDTTSEDDGFSVIVATDGTRWKLLFEDTINIAQAGVIQGATSLDGIFNKVGLFCAMNGVSKLQLNSGEFQATETLLIYTGVTYAGVAMGRTTIRSSHPSEVMRRSLRPNQTNPATYIFGANIQDMTVASTLETKTAKILVGKRYRNCSEIRVDFARGSVGLSLGDGEGGGTLAGEQYFNETSFCTFSSCLTGVQFNGASNRNTFNTNSYANCDVAYDFSSYNNSSETNTFINENVEGCKRWAEWGIYIERVYKQTWIGITVENPTSNPYSCIFEDAGSQVFINLALIGSVTRSTKFGTRRSIILGMPTGGAQHLNPPSEIYGGLDVYGDLTRVMRGLQVRGKIQHYSTTSVASITLGGTTVPAGLNVTKTVAMPDLVQGNILSYGLNFDPLGLTFTPYCNKDGTAFVKIRNVTTSDITITAGTIVLNCVSALVTQ